MSPFLRPRVAAPWCLVLLLAAQCAGAEEPACVCEGEQTRDDFCTVALDGLPHSQTTEQGLWQSAPWDDAAWLPFPGGQAVRIEHALGRLPALVQVYLSFEKSADSGSRTAFSASGDLALISEVSAESVTIENNTEECFFLRVVLE